MEAATAPEPRRMTQIAERFLAGRDRIALTVVVIAAAGAAWILRFAQDDAFITYRFARNFARGDGLVFNPGERIEGYTNFLWTLLMAIPEKFGWDTPTFSVRLGVVIMVATVLVSYRLATRVLGDVRSALLAVMVLVANVTFIGYATGGLETMFQTLLVTSVALLVSADPVAPTMGRRRLAAGVISGLAVLTRLDSVVLIGALFLMALWLMRRSPVSQPTRSFVIATAQLGVPVLVIVVPWLVWKLDYYGNLVPNTFFAKSAGNPIVPFVYGIVYVLAFAASYGAFLFIGRFRRHRREFFAQPLTRGLFGVVTVWTLYICVVGADFMEFRFMVPILPILALLAGFLLDRYGSAIRQVALIGAMLSISGLHAVLPGIQYPVLTFRDIRHWPTDSPTSWWGMGSLLRREFPGDLDDPARPIVAVAPLGVISYESDLRTVDMLGLTDADIARGGHPIPLYYPGHVRMARVDQLMDKGVNLIIGQPTPIAPITKDVITLGELIGLYPAANLRQLPKTAEVIEIKLLPEFAWYVVYLRQNDQVDEAIARNNWRTFPIERSCRVDQLELDGLVRWVFRQAAQRTCPGL